MFRDRIRELFGPQADVYVRGAAEAPDDGKPRPRPQTFWVRLPTGERDFWVAFPRGRIERDPSTAFIEWGITGLAIAILGTFFIVWRLNRPLSELARAAAKLGKGTDPQPVTETGPSEIRDLTRAFNQMKEGLRKNERDRSTFLAGVSHDLRTPLSRLRLEVEMLDGKVDDTAQHAMIEDVGEMNAIIDQFIDFMRSEAAENAFAPVNISGARPHAAPERAARAGVQVRCDLDEVPLLMLRPLAMQRLTDNLLGNAARHAGGEIVVRTRLEKGLQRGPFRSWTVGQAFPRRWSSA